jgi:tetratricopeptide (TPR) repeat protein
VKYVNSVIVDNGAVRTPMNSVIVEYTQAPPGVGWTQDNALYLGHSSQVRDARALSAAGQFSEAIAIFSTVLEQNPGDMRTRVDRAGVYAQIGDVQRATADFDAAVASYPHYDRFYYARAVGKKVMGEDYGDDLEKCLELSPSKFSETMRLSAEGMLVALALPTSTSSSPSSHTEQ